MKLIKQIILFTIVMLSVNVSAQNLITDIVKSDYNKDTPIYEYPAELNQWSYTNNAEVISYEMTAKGYENSFNEVIKVLEFYKLNFDKTTQNDSGFSIRLFYTDFKLMDSTLKSEKGNIFKMWDGDNVRILWQCDKSGYFLAIKQYKRI